MNSMNGRKIPRTEARMAPLLYNRDLSFKSISGKYQIDFGQVPARLDDVMLKTN